MAAKMGFAALAFLIWLSFFPAWTGSAEPESPPLRAAFIRGGNLWLSSGGEETQLTREGKASGPKWSVDGRFIAFAGGEQAQDLVVYSLESKRLLTVYSGGGSRFEWSPAGDRLAFVTDAILNYADVGPERVEPFQNVIGGTGNYSWLPDGTGFLVSSEPSLQPDGWSPVRLFRVPVEAKMDSRKVKPLYTLPSQSDEFFAVGTSAFKWSSDRKWMAFQAIPTASLSADGNKLCVLSADGKTFRQVDDMLRYERWFQWAPADNRLAYISGAGRFAIQNKRLKIKSFPAVRTPAYTPEGYVDRDFTWEGDRFITVSRSKEAEWSGTEADRPLPALVRIDLAGGEQKQVTRPPANVGDFEPEYLESSRRLTWVRTDRRQAEVWLADANGDAASQAIPAIDVPSPYYEAYDWSAVLAWYEPKSEA